MWSRVGEDDGYVHGKNDVKRYLDDGNNDEADADSDNDGYSKDKDKVNVKKITAKMMFSVKFIMTTVVMVIMTVKTFSETLRLRYRYVTVMLT